MEHVTHLMFSTSRMTHIILCNSYVPENWDIQLIFISQSGNQNWGECIVLKEPYDQSCKSKYIHPDLSQEPKFGSICLLKAGTSETEICKLMA